MIKEKKLRLFNIPVYTFPMCVGNVCHILCVSGCVIMPGLADSDACDACLPGLFCFGNLMQRKDLLEAVWHRSCRLLFTTCLVFLVFKCRLLVLLVSLKRQLLPPELVTNDD